MKKKVDMVENVISSHKRIVYIDVLRIIACLMVIYNHTNERGFFWFSERGQFDAVWILDTFLSIMSRSAVPLFLMISGSLLLGRSETIWDTYKRIMRILIDLLIFSAFYICIDNIFHNVNFGVWDVIREILSNGKWHMWYLYAYIAFWFLCLY